MNLRAIKHLFFGLCFITLLGCKSEYEMVRTSNDPKLIYEKAIQFYDEEEFLKAQQLFELILNSYRGRPEFEMLNFRYAYTFYNMNQFVLAGHYFESFTTAFANSKLKEEAAFMSAYSKFRLSPVHRLDQKYTVEAIDEMQYFINTYPENEKVKECNDIIVELRKKLELKAFEQGELYSKLTNYESAIAAFETMLRDFPETERDEEVRYLIMRASYLWATGSFYERKIERFTQTIEYIEDFKKRYTRSKYIKEVRNMTKDAEETIKKIQNDGY
jgi:outer membrane protein assembly factor BamD